jgi:hypothetical protein
MQVQVQVFGLIFTDFYILQTNPALLILETYQPARPELEDEDL